MRPRTKVSAAFRLSKNWKVVFVSACNIALKWKCSVKKKKIPRLSIPFILVMCHYGLWKRNSRNDVGVHTSSNQLGEWCTHWNTNTHISTQTTVSAPPTHFYTHRSKHFPSSSCVALQYCESNYKVITSIRAMLIMLLIITIACITKTLSICLPWHAQHFVLTLHYHTVWRQGFDISQVQEVMAENGSMSGRVLYSCASKASVL